MKRLPHQLATALLALLSCPLPTLGQEWRSYASAQDGFTILAPGEPARSTRQAGPSALHSYLVETPQAAYYVGVSDYGPQAAEANPQAQLQGAKNGELENAHARLLRERPLTLDGHPGIEFEAETATEPPLRYLARLYMAGTRLYQCLSIRPASAPETDARRFLDSFHWTEERKP